MVDLMIRDCCSVTNLCPSVVPFDGIKYQQTLFNGPCLPTHSPFQIHFLVQNAILGEHEKRLP